MPRSLQGTSIYAFVSVSESLFTYMSPTERPEARRSKKKEKQKSLPSHTHKDNWQGPDPTRSDPFLFEKVPYISIRLPRQANIAVDHGNPRPTQYCGPCMASHDFPFPFPIPFPIDPTFSDHCPYMCLCFERASFRETGNIILQ